MSKFINKKTKGQALLIVIVISTLALIILIAMADRIIASRVNIQRSEEFDRSVSIAENKVNEIIRVLDADVTATSKCINSLGNLSSYQTITCTELASTNAKIYVKSSSNTPITISSGTPLTHQVGTSISQGKPVSGIVATCEGFNTSTPPQFIITRIYLESGIYYADKGIYTCTSSLPANNDSGNVTLYSARQNLNPNVTGTIRTNTIAIRVKPYLDGQPATKVKLNTYGNSVLQSATAKYEFLVTGLGELGSDSAISFERPMLGNASFTSGFFDYAYFGEDR